MYARAFNIPLALTNWITTTIKSINLCHSLQVMNAQWHFDLDHISLVCLFSLALNVGTIDGAAQVNGNKLLLFSIKYSYENNEDKTKFRPAHYTIFRCRKITRNCLAGSERVILWVCHCNTQMRSRANSEGKKKNVYRQPNQSKLQCFPVKQIYQLKWLIYRNVSNASNNCLMNVRFRWMRFAFSNEMRWKAKKQTYAHIHSQSIT